MGRDTFSRLACVTSSVPAPDTFLPSVFLLLRLYLFLRFVKSILASSPVREQFSDVKTSIVQSISSLNFKWPCPRTQLNNVHLPVLTPTASATFFQNFFFLHLYPQIIWGFVVEGGIIANFSYKTVRRKQYSQTPFWDRGVIGNY